ncbi:MAG: hypothetical protein H7333_06300 [Bdellovibrionales bacterium]|nr:hypothetical protein [Oligoflexia bacterium]
MALLIIGFGFVQTSPLLAQETDPSPSPSSASALSTPSAGSAMLSQRALEITKTSMQVLKEEEGVVNLTLYANHSLVNKAQVVFFRRKGARVEVIASGAVTGEKKNPVSGLQEIIVELDRDTVIKYPQKGDYAVPMSDPNAVGNGDKKDQYNFLVPEEPAVKEENDRSGYLEYGMGLMQGTLTTQATLTSLANTMVNGAKKTNNYRFGNTHFAYFSDFFPVGFELDSHSGNFPTQTYYNKIVKSSESISTLSFDYRLKTLFNRHLAPVLKVVMLNDQFTTDNTDENLLSTKVNGMGFGLRANYDLVDPLWKAEKGRFFLKLQNLYGEYVYYPSLTVSDTMVSRGTSSPGSTGSQYRLGFNALAYLRFIPIFKRFVIQGSYGVRAYSFKFAGSTVSEVGNINQIPQNGASQEKEQDYRFFVGIRFEDPVRLLFADSKKDKN